MSRCACTGDWMDKVCSTGGGWTMGGHVYTTHVTRVTYRCSNGCGCWMGRFNSGGPEGVDPHGDCPEAVVVQLSPTRERA